MSKIILVADDEPHIINLLAEALTKEGYEVWTAADGLKAMEHITQHKPDLIILDIIMPRLSGAELFFRLREDQTTQDIPVIVLSAIAGDYKKREGENLEQPDMCIGKPWDQQKLLTAIRQLLEGGKKNP